jgi:bacterial leucyl aminopeptidase
MNGRAPGADDDGSGTVTILEAMRVLLTDSRITNGQMPNTLEFHWYSAEEGGLLGSQAIFSQYKRDGRDVKAMLQQDMTGYIDGTLKKGKKESIGIITDYVDSSLTAFLRRVVKAVSSILFPRHGCISFGGSNVPMPLVTHPPPCHALDVLIDIY